MQVYAFARPKAIRRRHAKLIRFSACFVPAARRMCLRLKMTPALPENAFPAALSNEIKGFRVKPSMPYMGRGEEEAAPRGQRNQFEIPAGYPRSSQLHQGQVHDHGS